MGFFEHFEDFSGIIERHVDFLRPSGILILGCPNFLGINGWFLKRLAPKRVAQHNLISMDTKNWSDFERKRNLKTLFRGYVGGFNPSVFCRREFNTWETWVLLTVARILRRLVNFPIFKRINSQLCSTYVLGIYQAPDAPSVK